MITGAEVARGLQELENHGIALEPVDWKPVRTLTEFMKTMIKLEKDGPEGQPVPQRVFELIKEADFLVVHYSPVTRKMIETAKRLKLIGCLRGGHENVNVEAATAKGIIATNAPGRTMNAVADFSFGMILAAARRIAIAYHLLKKGVWEQAELRGDELHEKTLGIFGFGNIGRGMAERARGFRMRVIAYDPYVDKEKIKTGGAEPVNLDQLFKESDFLSVHARLSPETRKMIGKELISLMKPTAYIINTSRGQIIDQRALYDALKAKKIAGAALDVFEEEPLGRNAPILKLENVTATPHLAGHTKETLFVNPERIVAEDIVRFLKGERPLNMLNPEVWKDSR